MILFTWGRAANQACAGRYRIGGVALAVLALSCTQSARTDDNAQRSADTTSDSARLERRRPPVVPVPRLALPPLADSIANRLVFDPTVQNTFLVALQGGRLLMDLGRVDDNVTKTPDRLAAYRVAVDARSPVAKGARVRVRGPWGDAADATVDSFDVASGRIVGVLARADVADSVAKPATGLIGLADLVPTSATVPPAATTPPADQTPEVAAQPNAVPQRDTSLCQREWDDATRARAASVRDSLEGILRAGDPPVYLRLRTSLKVKKSMLAGCFPGGRAVIAVALYGGDFEWVREKVVLLTNTGGVRALTVRDYRMRVHDLIDAFDADDNGRDDVAARGFTTRAGAQVVLRFTENKLERIAAGFAWER